MTTTISTTLSGVNIITVFSTANVINKSPRTTVILSFWIWRLFSVLVVIWISRSNRRFSFITSSWLFCFFSSCRVGVFSSCRVSVFSSGCSSLNTAPIIVFNTPLLTIFFISNSGTIFTTWEFW